MFGGIRANQVMVVYKERGIDLLYLIVNKNIFFSYYYYLYSRKNYDFNPNDKQTLDINLNKISQNI